MVESFAAAGWTIELAARFNVRLDAGAGKIPPSR